MPVDRAKIEIGTPQVLRKELFKVPMQDRPLVQSIANLAVELERARILEGVRKLVGKAKR